MEQSPATFRSDKVTPRIGEAVTVALDRLCLGRALASCGSLSATIKRLARRRVLPAASYTNPMNRPAATMPTHNESETSPETFAPMGKTSPSSHVATFR